MGEGRGVSHVGAIKRWREYWESTLNFVPARRVSFSWSESFSDRWTNRSLFPVSILVLFFPDYSFLLSPNASCWQQETGIKIERVKWTEAIQVFFDTFSTLFKQWHVKKIKVKDWRAAKWSPVSSVLQCFVLLLLSLWRFVTGSTMWF